MPEPVSIVATLLAGGLGAYSAISSASAQRRSEEYNAKIAENAATAAKQDAAYEADRLRAKNRKILAAQKAGFAASGVLIEGSVSDVILDSATQGELDVAAATYEGETRSQAYLSEARLSRMRARSASTSGVIGAASSLIGSAATATATYAGYRDRKKHLIRKGRDNG